MSTYTIRFTRCDGCGKTNQDGAVNFRSRHSVRGGPGLPDDEARTIDLCEECVQADRYYCRFCGGVHDDDHPCEEMRRLNAEVEADILSGEAYR